MNQVKVALTIAAAVIAAVKTVTEVIENTTKNS